MSDIPSFPYALLWGERVAALGRQPDARATASEFLALGAARAGAHGGRAASRSRDANDALDRLRRGAFAGPPCSPSAAVTKQT